MTHATSGRDRISPTTLKFAARLTDAETFYHLVDKNYVAAAHAAAAHYGAISNAKN